MLHGVIPAAFFATLLRRYLDSISETPPCTELATSSIGYFETSAAIATIGMAVYGITRLSGLSKRKNEVEAPKTFEIFEPQEMKEPVLRVKKRPVQKKVTRKHKRKDKKKWFLNNMKKYKSKYGHKIGKLMNQFLGRPAAGHPDTQSIDLEDSDDDELEDDPTDIFESSPFGRCSEDADVVMANDIPNGECAVSSKGQFEDDDEDTKGMLVDRGSSSIELKKILRNNFEVQRRRKLGGRRSSESLQSGFSSESSSGRFNGKTFLDEGRSSSKKNISPRRMDRTFYRDEEKRRRKKPKTRSGRCYNNLFA